MPDKKIERLVLLITILLVFASAARTPIDTDMWWHLQAGKDTLKAGIPTLQDLHSFTRENETWNNHSWLAQVIWYLAYQIGGYRALGFLMALSAAISILLVYLQMDGHPLLKAFIAILIVLVAAPTWTPRPQLFSLVLFGGILYLLYLYKRKRNNKLWLIPILMVIWSNIHGGYVLGILACLFMLAGESFNHIWGNEDCLSWREIRNLGLITILSCLVVVINPNGIGVWQIPFQTVGVGSLQQSIDEWASPDFHQFFQQPLLWLILILFVTLGASGKRADGTDLVYLTGFLAMALIAKRNAAPFALAAAPILARHIVYGFSAWILRSSFLTRFIESQKQSGSPVRPVLRTAINFVITGLLMVACIYKWLAATDPEFINDYIEMHYPARAINWVESHQLTGRMLNEYQWGGYIQWFSPDTKIFLDGRTDLFGDEVIGDWLAVVEGREGWQNIARKWKIEYLMIQPDRPVCATLEQNGWQILYADDTAVIYGQRK